MTTIYYCKLFDIAQPSKGLCNQLFSLISAIIIAIKSNKKLVIVDHFLVDFSKKETSPISYLIDIPAFNIFLQKKYNISIRDRIGIAKHESIDPKLFVLTFYWINKLDRIMFDDIIRNMPFVPYLNTLARDFVQPKLENTNKVNILHLRLEEDGFQHWSKQNFMDTKRFEEVISAKYIGLINKFLNKDDINIILSYSTENKVIEYMRTNGYKYFFSEKKFAGREVNAALDLMIGTHCNNVFIGNFNLENLNGSSLSYVLINHLQQKPVTKVLIDLDHILDEAKIVW